MINVKTKRSTLFLTLGSIFEYYDFMIYGLMSGYLGPLFFPSESVWISQLQAFTFFALGYIVRPLGGLVFAILGDTTNRKRIFILSNFILAISTVIIAVIPNYSQIGITATITLVVLRMLQAASFAVELPGAMTLIKQNTDAPTRSFSFVISGASLGAIFATASLYILENVFTLEEILSFAWRIPFIIGSALCLVSALMRKKLPNTPEVKDKSSVFADLIFQYKNVIYSTLIVSLQAFLVIMNIFFPSFIPKFYGYEVKEVYLAITISLVWAVVYAPVFSYLTHKISKAGLLRAVIASAMFLGLVINFLWLRHSFSNLLIGLFIYQTITVSLITLMFPLMAEIFPSKARFTLTTVCYNMGYSIMAFSPMLVAKLSDHWKSPFAMWLIMIVLCIFILVNIANLGHSEED